MVQQVHGRSAWVQGVERPADCTLMATRETTKHTFLVRIWHEPREIAEAPPVLRGTVEHIPSGTRQSFADLQSLCAFLDRFVRSPDAPDAQAAPPT